jgi:sugar lactone lactonase YvrE
MLWGTREHPETDTMRCTSLLLASLTTILLGAPARAADETLQTIAGFGIGDGEPATQVRLTYGRYSALDAAGNLLIPEALTNRIRRVDAVTRIITTVAGTGVPAPAGDGGPAHSASLLYPEQVAFDAAGCLYVGGTSTLRKIAPGADGLITGAPDETISSVAGVVAAALAADAAGTVFYADSQPTGATIRRIDPSTGAATRVVGGGMLVFSDGIRGTDVSFSRISACSFGPDGALYFADPLRVYRLDPGADGVVTGASDETLSRLPGQFQYVYGVLADDDGSFFVSDAGRIQRVDRLTGVVTILTGYGTINPATYLYPAAFGLRFDAERNLVYGNTLGIYRITPGADGHVRGAADERLEVIVGSGRWTSGDGGPALDARLSVVQGLACDAHGNLFISELNSDGGVRVDATTGLFSNGAFVRRIDAATGVITRVAGNGTLPSSGDGGHPLDAGVNDPRGLAFDAAGNLYIADYFGKRVRRVTPGADGIVNGGADETISTFAGGGTLAPEGVPATSAQLWPGFLAFDAAGGLYLTTLGKVARISPETGLIGTVYTATSSIAGIGLAPDGALLVAEGPRIRRIDAAGATTIAGTDTQGFGALQNGGHPRAGSFFEMSGFSVDGDGNIFVSEHNYYWDIRRSRILLINPANEFVRILAGAPWMGEDTLGKSPDGTLATASKLYFPSSVIPTPDGALVFSEEYIQRDIHTVRTFRPDLAVPEWPEGATIEVRDAQQTFATLVFPQARYAGGALRRYRVFQDTWLTRIIPAPADPDAPIQLDISGIPGTEYAVRVVADAPNGAMSASLRGTFRTLPVLDVRIDVKPRATPNSIKLGSGGSVPVAIFGSDTFAAERTNPLTVRFASSWVDLRGNGTYMATPEDVDGDGRLDFIVHVATEALQLTAGDTEAELTGQTADGILFRGKDSVRVVE